MFACYTAFDQYPAKRQVRQLHQITEIHQGLVFLIYNYTRTVGKNKITIKKQRERERERSIKKILIDEKDEDKEHNSTLN